MQLLSILIIAVTVLVACRDQDGTSDDFLRVYPSEDEVMSKAYDSTYSVPPGFFVDERADTEGSYSVYHVKDASGFFELCTDNYDEAYTWESLDNESRAVNGLYVGSHENERYFEVIRELEFPDGIGNISDPTSPGFSRVFKCSYVNRDGVYSSETDGFAGTLYSRPLATGSVKTFVEYMWQFTFFWPRQKKVLESFTEETPLAYEHTLLLSFLTKRGFEQCDLIEVVGWVFSIDKTTGQINKHFDVIYEFEARLANGKPEKCSA